MNGVQIFQKTADKPKCKKQTNAYFIIKQLELLGVDSVFGYPGASVLSLYNELSESKLIKHYLVRHEQAALHAAEGYSRTSGKAGIVLVTSGPGFTNTVTGIANAYADSTPLVVLAGDVTDGNTNSKIFQDVNIKEMVKTCCKNVYTMSAKENPSDLIKKAYIEAISGVKGPVVVVLPRNILESPSSVKESISKTDKKTTHNFSREIKALNSLISKSTKPLVLVGGGAIDSSEQITEFVSRLNCPVVSTLMGIGVYPTSDKNYLGMIGINGTFEANSAVNKCDLLIAMGVSFSERTTCKNKYFGINSKIVSININNINKSFELNINSDTEEFLSSYLKTKSSVRINNLWESELRNIKDENVKENHNGSKMDSPSVLRIISEHTAKYEPIVVTDVGQHQMLTAQFFTFNKSRKFITSGGMGTMGFGLPAAYGAQIANPNHLILNITGDGSFQMNLQELATCREHNIPIKIIILNNGSLGMVRQLQEKMYKKTYQVNMINPDFTKIAEAYDLYAVRVTKKSEIIPALDKVISHNGTAIMDIMIDSHENI